jgi:hypothetical protein
VQTIPGKSSVASRDILNIAEKCDRVIVLESKDVGRLPGALVRDSASEFAAIQDNSTANVVALAVQPPGDDPSVDTLDTRTVVQLSRHILEVMAGA